MGLLADMGQFYVDQIRPMGAFFSATFGIVGHGATLIYHIIQFCKQKSAPVFYRVLLLAHTHELSRLVARRCSTAAGCGSRSSARRTCPSRWARGARARRRCSSSTKLAPRSAAARCRRRCCRRRCRYPHRHRCCRCCPTCGERSAASANPPARRAGAPRRPPSAQIPRPSPPRRPSSAAPPRPPPLRGPPPPPPRRHPPPQTPGPTQV